MISARYAFCLCFGLLVLPLSAPAANLPPQKVGTIADATLFAGATAEVVDLSPFFTDPDTTGMRLTTSLGSMDIALYKDAAPLTVANFLNYVNSGRYLITDPTTGAPAPIFFHRSVASGIFVIQTGGFLDTSSPTNPMILRPTAVTTFAAVKNEPGISNIRGTIAMAKIELEPDSATSQWFINTADNSGMLDTENGGFTVFARVLGDGMTVADAIAALPVFNFGVPFDTVPLIDYTQADFDAGTPASPANGVTVSSITPTIPLTFSASSNNTAVASVAISGNNLLVTPKALGSAVITATGTDADGASVAQTFTVTIVSNPVHLANISTRVVVGPGDGALIGGFIVRGTTPKRVAIRGLGPSLTDDGLVNVLGNPTLELHDGTGAILETNDNWQDGPNAQEVIDVGLAPKNVNESVILTTIPATTAGAAYTAVVQGAAGGSGFALVEVYDLDSGPGSSILNISTRGNVTTGDSIMIGGVIVFGDGSQRVLVRALGPSLAGSVSNPLSDPTLTLVDSNGMQIDFNDNWQDNPDAPAIEATTIPPTDPKESAVLDTLPAGGYTALVRGAGGATGTALVEVYALPPP